MTPYALLLQPSANRVYADASVALSLAELEVLRTVVGDRIGPAEVLDLAGHAHLALEADLDEPTLTQLSSLSCAWALYERVGDALRPVRLTPLARFDDDLLTILKYRGKTNELFTRMLLNLTVWASDSGPDLPTRRIRVLDPLCGRGTTLNEALHRGWHASGVDQDERDVEAYAAFLRTWLKDKRLKHTADTTRLRRDGRTLGQRFDARIGLDKESWKAGDALEVSVAAADTLSTAEIFRARSFDVLVADAPYGVQHGSTSGAGLRRGPLDLLREALPGWHEVLRPGGAIGLSWNSHVAPRAAVVEALQSVGLTPLDDGPWRSFEHRVDRSILRDVVVARREPA